MKTSKVKAVAGSVPLADKTKWNKVLSQSEAQVEKISRSDVDSPVLENRRYYKPGKKLFARLVYMTRDRKRRSRPKRRR